MIQKRTAGSIETILCAVGDDITARIAGTLALQKTTKHYDIRIGGQAFPRAVVEGKIKTDRIKNEVEPANQGDPEEDNHEPRDTQACSDKL